MSIHEDWKEEPVPPKPTSGCTKVLVVLLVVGGVCALICCGGVGYVVWRIQKGISKEPAVVREETAQIVTMDIPPLFEPVMSMNLLSFMRMVVYQTPGPEGEEGMLVLAQFNQQFFPGDDAAEAKMKEALHEQGKQNRDFDIVKTETREIQVKGKPVKFQFAELKDPKDQKEYRRVTGAFAGKSGPAWLMLQVPMEKYDEAAVVSMLESIK